jgi:pimeloyl-ACP methyl ester carboxylesterase
MSIAHTVVLLPGLGDTSAQITGQTAALEQIALLLTPDIGVSRTEPVILERSALSVLTAISAANTDQVVLVGHGWGCMIALHIAANHRDRVAALMLSTNAQLQTIMARSIFRGVVGLLPASVVQRLGGKPSDVAALFDQVRPVDFKPLAERVHAPALVVVGERDVANRGPSAALAQSLPLGNLRVVPQVGPAWRAQRPQVIAELLDDFLSGLT